MLIALAVGEQRRVGRPRRHRVNRDLAAAHLLGEDARHRLHAGLGRPVNAVGRLVEPNHARRKADDAPTVAHPRAGLAQAIEHALEVHRHLGIERRVVRLRDRAERHDAGVVDQHVDPAMGLLGGIEQRLHRRRIGDVRLDGARDAAGRRYAGDELARLVGPS